MPHICKICLNGLLSLSIFVAMGVAYSAKESQANCMAPKAPKILERKDVFKGKPFGSGEKSEFRVTYFGVFVGTIILESLEPVKDRGEFHFVFGGVVQTAPSYESLFVLRDRAKAYSRARDYGAAKFRMEQFEDPAFSDPFIQDKWIDFDLEKCKAYEVVQKGREKKRKKYEHFWQTASNDAVSSIFRLRELDLKVGKKFSFPVFTSEKNWSLQAKAISAEKIKTNVGTFKTIKLKLDTFLGKELQQKGDVHVWVATEHPNRPIVKIEGEVNVGSFVVELDKFKPGKS